MWMFIAWMLLRGGRVGPAAGGERQPRGLPALDALDDVGGAREAEGLEARGGEARGVALGAEEDDPVVEADVRVGVARVGVEPPLELGERVLAGAGDGPLRAALIGGAGVDEDRAGPLGVHGLGRR